MISKLAALPPRKMYEAGRSEKIISYRMSEPAMPTPFTPTLVFLHGFNGNSASWHYQFAHFEKRRMISIDAPGYGGTSVFDGGMPGFADEVISLLAKMALQPVLLIGHSMGGMLAQIIAAKIGEQCAGLILSCTHKGRGKTENEPLSEDVQNRIEQRQRLNDRDFGLCRVERMLSGPLAPDIQNFLVSISGSIRLDGIKWGGAAIQYLDTTPFLRYITAPILVLSAKNDIVVKPDALEALMADLPQAQHVKIDNVGHAPYCEDARVFNRLVEQFIARHATE